MTSFIAKQKSMVSLCQSVSIHLTAGRHMRYFQAGALMNNAAITIWKGLHVKYVFVSPG